MSPCVTTLLNRDSLSRDIGLRLKMLVGRPLKGNTLVSQLSGDSAAAVLLLLAVVVAGAAVVVAVEEQTPLAQVSPVAQIPA